MPPIAGALRPWKRAVHHCRGGVSDEPPSADLRGHRRSVRVNGVFPLWYRLPGGGLRKGCALNLSPEGALLLTHEPVAPGRSFPVLLKAPSRRHLAVTALVVWQKPIDRGRFLVGVRLRLAWSGHQDLIEELLSRHLGAAA